MVDEESTGIGSNPDRVLIELNGQSYYAGPAATMGVEARAGYELRERVDLAKSLGYPQIEYQRDKSKGPDKFVRSPGYTRSSRPASSA